MTIDTETRLIQKQPSQADAWPAPRASVNRLAASQGDPSSPELDPLKQLVRMIFERELRRLKTLPVSLENIPGQASSDSIDLPLRKLLGKHYPELKGRLRWRLACITRRSHLLQLKVSSMRELYRLLFRQALEVENLSPDAVSRLGEVELKQRLGGTLCQLMAVLRTASSVKGGKADQLENLLAWFDRQIQAWLEWCVSLLPYHAPALGEQDPQVILVRAARR